MEWCFVPLFILSPSTPDLGVKGLWQRWFLSHISIIPIVILMIIIGSSGVYTYMRHNDSLLKSCLHPLQQFAGNHWIMGTTGIMRTSLLPWQSHYVSVDEVICYADGCRGYNLERALRKSAHVKWRRAGACPGCALRKAACCSCREARRWRPCQAEVLLGLLRSRLRILPERPTQAWAPRTESSHPPALTTPVVPARPLGAWPIPATLRPPGPPLPVWATMKSSGPSAREILRLSN